MFEELRIVLKNKNGVSFPLVIDVTLLLLLISCGVSRYFRLQIIAAGVRDAVEDTIISMVNDNYAGVYHGVQKGYSGRYIPYGEGEWEGTLDEGDIYARIDEVPGARKNGGYHVKFTGDSGDAVEFALTGLNVTLRSAPLAPSDLGSARRFGAGAVIGLEVPVRFGRKPLPSTHITLWVQAGYIKIF